eukprot:TRINITY_DN13563_c0_g1_i1.p4 TRINITY_DN13563_c0_g1~~TRINITY_DN13563_c0_g1_i1.p4  ORF type:complete len:162 (-),score=3.95 TRINITY_DN13563_c0_g1_i1:4-489(-)
MSRLIRGRRIKWVAGVVMMLMLETILLPWTTLPSFAQETGSTGSQGTQTVLKYFGEGARNTAALIVLDFENKSNYKTGMLGRMTADSLALELLKTREFDVVPHAAVESGLTEANLTQPLSWEKQSQLAELLKKKLVLSGSIDDVQIYKKREGTYADPCTLR